MKTPTKIIQQRVLPFKLERTAQRLTSHSGLLLCYEMALGLGLIRDLDYFLPLPGSPRGYFPSRFVMLLVLMFHGGGRSLEDTREIAEDRGLMKVLGVKRFPSSSTLGDWLRRMGEDGLTSLCKVNMRVNEKILSTTEEEELTLDIDATVIESEKQEAKWTYKKVKGYQPLLGFLKEREVCILDEFRDGNVPSSFKVLEFLKRCEALMQGGKRIKRLRMDSAGYQAEVINHCEERGMYFTITAEKDRAVKEVIKNIPEEDWVELKTKEGMSTGREVAEAVHTMERTKKAFRLIVQRWQNPQPELFNSGRYCYHAIATNFNWEREEVIWWHNGRGKTENLIKELKLGFGMDWVPCGEFMANAVFFRIGVIAYNLFQALKYLALPQSWRCFTVSTIRWRLYQVAGKVIESGRQLVLKIVAGIEKLHLFEKVRLKCFQCMASL